MSGVLGGCASPQMSRIDRNRDLYEQWPLDVRQAILDGKVEKGMTPEMVRVAWGEPTDTMPSPSGPGEEIWVYRSGGSPGTVYYPGGGMSTIGGPGIGMGSPGVGITMGQGGAVLNGGGSIGMGGTGIGGPIMGGIGSPGPIITPPTPVEEKEVVFRNGVVYRADNP
jgi:hypothetical protein